MWWQASINALVTQTSKRLILKVRKYGIYENFGQDELRKLNDLYSKTYGILPRYENMKTIQRNSQRARDLYAIKKFSTWILTYKG